VLVLGQWTVFSDEYYDLQLYLGLGL